MIKAILSGADVESAIGVVGAVKCCDAVVAESVIELVAKRLVDLSKKVEYFGEVRRDVALCDRGTSPVIAAVGDVTSGDVVALVLDTVVDADAENVVDVTRGIVESTRRVVELSSKELRIDAVSNVLASARMSELIGEPEV